MGTLVIGGGEQGLQLRLTRDAALFDTIEQQAGKNHPTLPEGTPIDWPAGTKAWITIRNKGADVSARWDLEVTGPHIYIDADVQTVNAVSRVATARFWLEYPADVTSDPKPFVWCAGEVSWHG